VSRFDADAKIAEIYASSQLISDEVVQRRRAAHVKHGDNSIEAIDATDPRWLSILMEEIGEAAHEMTYDAGGTIDSLRDELMDSITVLTAWVASIDGQD
jgi:hypothetical protein